MIKATVLKAFREGVNMQYKVIGHIDIILLSDGFNSAGVNNDCNIRVMIIYTLAL